MTDNKTRVGKSDRIRINFHEAYEIRYWTNKWRVTREQLEAARQETGSVLVKSIEKYLRRQGLIP